MELDILLNTIDSLKNDIDLLRPIEPEIEQRVMQKFRLDWNYHSNNIEGNQLTYGETKTFLLHGITAKGKTLKDHLDIKGHNEVLLMLNDIIKEESPLTEAFIRELHITILQAPYASKAQTADGKIISKKIEIGKYKSQPNHVLTQTGEMHYFSSPEETPAKMHDLIDWYKNEHENNEIHPLIIASLFHIRFIEIHPFDDGNGRLARILMNLILMSHGYSPVIIKTENKNEYYSTLQQADGGNNNEFIKYVGHQLIHSLALFLKGAKGENIEELTDIDKEINLLKASLHNNDSSNTQYLNVAIAKSVYEKVTKPLLEFCLDKLSTFDELFTQRNILYKCFDKTPTSKSLFLSPLFSIHEKFDTCQNVENLIIILNNLFEQMQSDEDILDMRIAYGLGGFIKSNKSLVCIAEFSIKYQENMLTISHHNPNIATFFQINIPYNNIILLDEDKHLIANTLSKTIFTQITNHLKN